VPPGTVFDPPDGFVKVKIDIQISEGNTHLVRVGLPLSQVINEGGRYRQPTVLRGIRTTVRLDIPHIYTVLSQRKGKCMRKTLT
jgi:hypothetical protein